MIVKWLLVKRYIANKKRWISNMLQVSEFWGGNREKEVDLLLLKDDGDMHVNVFSMKFLSAVI